MSRFRLLCLLGFLGSLLAWVLPTRVKPYHIKRDLEDYKILLVEQNSEGGFADDGLVKVRTTTIIALPTGGSRELLGPVRQEWIDTISRSKDRWPAGSGRVHYDEWGPIHTTRENGIEVMETGNVSCVPYSVFAIVLSIPLVWHLAFRNNSASKARFQAGV